MSLRHNQKRINICSKRVILVSRLMLVKTSASQNVLLVALLIVSQQYEVGGFHAWRRFDCRAFFIFCDTMDKNKTAVFIGHGDCPLSVEDIIPFIEQAIRNGVDTFLNGGQGSFDINAAFAVHKLKDKYPNIKNVLCIPYHNFKIYDKELFDEIINPNTSNSVSYTGYKTAIPKRNRYMVLNSIAAICYVNHISGGAYKTYQLAEKKNLYIINIKNSL